MINIKEINSLIMQHFAWELKRVSKTTKTKNCEKTKNCKQVKLETEVEGDPKAPFSIATTPRCRGGRYSFSWIALLYPWSIPYNAEC